MLSLDCFCKIRRAIEVNYKPNVRNNINRGYWVYLYIYLSSINFVIKLVKYGFKGCLITQIIWLTVLKTPRSLSCYSRYFSYSADNECNTDYRSVYVLTLIPATYNCIDCSVEFLICIYLAYISSFLVQQIVYVLFQKCA